MDFGYVFAYYAGEDEAYDEACAYAYAGHGCAFRKDDGEDVARERAEGHADAELLGAAADGEGEDAGDADYGNEEGDGGESTKDYGVETVGGEDFSADIGEGAGFLDGLVRVHLMDGLGDERD